MKKKELVMLVGNIGSGKSTLCKKYQKKGYVVLSRDTLRYAIGGGEYIFNKKFEPIISRLVLIMFEEFLDLTVPIVVDETTMNRSFRSRYILLAKEYGYKVKCHVMPKLTMKKSVQRRLNNPHGKYSKRVWESVWKRLNKMYEEPSLGEGINKIIKEK